MSVSGAKLPKLKSVLGYHFARHAILALTYLPELLFRWKGLCILLQSACPALREQQL